MGSSKRKHFRKENKSISFGQPRAQSWQTCPDCNGKKKQKVGVGVVKLIPCVWCKGKGRIPLKKKVE